jgi:hypothetical protein
MMMYVEGPASLGGESCKLVSTCAECSVQSDICRFQTRFWLYRNRAYKSFERTTFQFFFFEIELSVVGAHQCFNELG